MGHGGIVKPKKTRKTELEKETRIASYICGCKMT